MSKTGVTIRPAEERDFPEITAIYAHHVRHGTASFEETPPPNTEMMARWRKVIDSGQFWLVATGDTGVLGYAYTGLYHPRPAWRFTVEDSIYVDADATGRGIGRSLLEALMKLARDAGIHQMVAVIGDSENAGSIGVHRACGFEHTGVLKNVGYKFERWLDVVIMQCDLRADAAEASGVNGNKTEDEEQL
jgi:phosphinothricin acetyltransferase